MRTEDWLRRAAVVNPTTIAIDDGHETLNYAELDRQASEVAGRLAGMGLEKGTTALLTLGEGIGKVIQLHALFRIGVTVIPVEQDLPGAEVARILETTGPDHELGPGDGLTGVTGKPLETGRPDPSDVLCRILTGGSTGKARAIGLTRLNHLTSAAGSALNLGLGEGDRWLCAVPLSHVSGFSILVRATIYGTGVFLADRFSPELMRQAVEDHGVNTASLVPTMLKRVIEDGQAVPPGLRFALLGGGPVPPELVSTAWDFGVPVVPTYGLTEACSQVATSTPRIAREKPGSAGPPLPGTELMIEGGEILVRGATVSPEASSPDGWLRTGDLGRLDEDGHLYVEGRRDRAILSGGEKIQPAEVEAVLARHPDVAEAVVFGVADPEWQQAVTAAVVSKVPGEAGEEALIAFCGEELAPFKVPKQVVFLPEIPLTGAGKVDLERLVAVALGRTS